MLNIENPAILPTLKEMISSLAGVTIAMPKSRHRTGLDEALDDVENGRVREWNSFEEMMQTIMSEPDEEE